MAERPTTILSSPYFQPKIVESFLRSALESAALPNEALSALRRLPLQRLPSEDKPNDFAASSHYIQDAFHTLEQSLTSSQREALRDLIKALSSYLVVSNTGVKSNEESFDRSQTSVLGSLNEARCLVGYCKILDRQWQEAVIELDLVREYLFRVRKRQAPSSSAAATSKEHRDLVYHDCLSGLQLVYTLLEREADVTRIHRWRKKSS